MRAYPLTTLNGGINRLQVKGGASAKQLYDLQNAWITNAGSVVPREGTIVAATLDSSTVGLAAANGQFNIFSSSFSTAALPANYVLNVLSDPSNSTASPTKIWFAKPFMGFLYVVAQFSDGDIFHYWLQNNGTWTSSTDYTSASIVLPPVPNGLAYQGVRDFPVQPLWTADTVITSGSYVEPNEATGFAYQAVATTGTPVHTGGVEPVWPTVAGGILQEFGDFDLSTTDAGTTQGSGTLSTAAALGSTITDRYGDSATVSNAGIFATSSTLSTLTLASTKVTTWKAGTNYAPGAVVIPTSNQGAFVNAIPNGDFEGGSGAGGWSFTDAGGTVQWGYSSTLPYQGTECIAFPSGAGIGADGAYATMTSYSLVTPGQSVTATGYLDPNNSGANLELWLQINWYDASDTQISFSRSSPAEGGGYRQVVVIGIAPAGAAHARVAIRAGSGTSGRNQGFADLISWNLATPAPITNFLFEAVQPAAGSSAAQEPTWPTALGAEVIDGGVTWQAIGTSIITWQAIPLMQSGLMAPTFPTVIGNTVHDPSTYKNVNGYVTSAPGMSWITVDRHIADVNDPNTVAVTLGASHVFAGDNDIVNYSAAVNPTDWTSTNNAGYLPTGLNNYGDNPITALTLYRSNLIAFNAGGYQMWQIDPDPQNMALLDAQPVGSIYPRAAQSVANDLLFLTEVGVRNLGTVGATANMAIGNTGQPVDPLIKAQLQAATYDPLSLYYPGRGQYWLIFGPQAFVLTINGNSQKSWSRYIFPDTITDWTLNAGILYLRTAGNLVWQLDAATLVDSLNAGGNGTISLLLHMDGANGSSAFVDSSGYGFPITSHGPTQTTGDFKFGPASGSFGGGANDLSTPLTAAGPLDLSGGDFTVECWIKPTNAFDNGIFLTEGIAGTNGFYFQINNTGALGASMNWSGGLFTPTGGAYTPGAWQHVALVVHLNTATIYLNGIGGSPVALIGAMITPTGSFWVGGDGVAVGFTGGIDEVCVTKGVAKYTANFIPPVAPFNPSTFDYFDGLMQWPYLDMGTLGRNKMMVGVDIVGDGSCSIQVAYNQADKSTFNDNPLFSTSSNVTAPYLVTVDDTLPGQPLPIPINAPSYSLILTFPGHLNTASPWSWEAANLYITDAAGAGAMG